MEERRISVRVNLLGVTAKISQDGKTWWNVNAKDISDGGLGFDADVEFTKGTQLLLEGETTDYIKSRDISCDVKVVFVGKMSDGKYTYGVKFLNMTKAQHTNLSVLIEMIATKYPAMLMD